jgi:hypothetical protein
VSDNEKPVPEPGEVCRDDDEIQYHEVDETNVGDADRSPKPPRTSSVAGWACARTAQLARVVH